MVNPKADSSREIGRLHNVVLVVGSLDYDIESYGDGERLEFSREGSDEMDPVSGRGWAMIEEGQLHGQLYFHQGDDSGFVAEESL